MLTSDGDTDTPVQRWRACCCPQLEKAVYLCKRGCLSAIETYQSVFRAEPSPLGGLSVILLISYSNPLGRNFNWTVSWSCGFCQCCYHLRHSRPLQRLDLSLSKFPVQSGLGFKPYCSQKGQESIKMFKIHTSSLSMGARREPRFRIHTADQYVGARRKSGCNYDLSKCQENKPWTSLCSPEDEGDLGEEPIRAHIIHRSGPPDINRASLSGLWTPDPVFRGPLLALSQGSLDFSATLTWLHYRGFLTVTLQFIQTFLHGINHT